MIEDHQNAETQHTLEIIRIRLRALDSYASSLQGRLNAQYDNPATQKGIQKTLARQIDRLYRSLTDAINEVRSDG